MNGPVEILQSRICQQHSLTPERVCWFEWYDHHQDMSLQFTEYLPREARWRPSHSGDREILMILKQSQGAGVSD